MSVAVEAALLLPKVSTTRLEAIDGIRVPGTLTLLAVNVHVMLSVELSAHVMPEAVPFWVMSDVVKEFEPTAREKMTV